MILIGPIKTCHYIIFYVRPFQASCGELLLIKYRPIIAGLYPETTKHLYNICRKVDQRRRRLEDIVQMLYKCFVFAVMVL